MNERLFRNTSILFIIIGVLDYVGIKIFLYWTTWWYDMLLHFLAGFVVAMTVVLFLQTFSKAFEVDKISVVLASVLFTLFVGLVWELFELYYEITFFSDGMEYWTDTTSDLILDTMGGFLGTKYSFRVLKKYA